MNQLENMTQAELAAYVQTHLESEGIRVVLSGGAAVAIYTRDKYVSQDIDLVNIYQVKRRRIRESMRRIGFHEEGRHFKHPDTQFFVEFPPGPLTIGAHPVTDVIEIDLSTGSLRIISPTECVKDRLAAFFYWGDSQCLEQAILVTQEHSIDLEDVRRWSDDEGMHDAFEKIKRELGDS